MKEEAEKEKQDRGSPCSMRPRLGLTPRFHIIAILVSAALLLDAAVKVNTLRR